MNRYALPKSVYYDVSLSILKMRKIVLIVLCTVGLSLQGKAGAELNGQSISQYQAELIKIEEIQIEWLLNEVVAQTGLPYSEVRELYESENLTIEKEDDHYVIRMALAEGGMTTILIAEGF